MRTKTLVLLLSWSLVTATGACLAADPTTLAAKPFATVGEAVVSRAEYQRALAVAMRKKYYHAKPPEAEYQQFQQAVGEEVVNRVLLLAEARRRGIQPDTEKIAATLAGYDRQYGGSETWKTSREKMLASVRPQLESESLLARLEEQVKRVAAPDESVARAFYEKNRSLFVEPEQVKLSLILLKVDPSSPQAVWNSAKEEGQRIHQRLKAGSDFAELARLHSGDASANQGGQMDYIHRGMLPELLATTADSLKPREFSEPVQILQGVAILRLDGRRPAQQRPFEAVRQRSSELWQREQGEDRWKSLITDLRRATPVRIDESQYVPLPAATEKSRAG
jgi:parvulin-like peptidyl-prolyl isomerase